MSGQGVAAFCGQVMRSPAHLWRFWTVVLALLLAVEPANSQHQEATVNGRRLLLSFPAGYCPLVAGDAESEARMRAWTPVPDPLPAPGWPIVVAAPCGDAGNVDALQAGTASFFTMQLDQQIRGGPDRASQLAKVEAELRPAPRVFGLSFVFAERDANAVYAFATTAPWIRRPAARPEDRICFVFGFTAGSGFGIQASLVRHCADDAPDTVGLETMRDVMARFVAANP